MLKSKRRQSRFIVMYRSGKVDVIEANSVGQAVALFRRKHRTPNHGCTSEGGFIGYAVGCKDAPRNRGGAVAAAKVRMVRPVFESRPAQAGTSAPREDRPGILGRIWNKVTRRAAAVLFLAALAGGCGSEPTLDAIDYAGDVESVWVEDAERRRSFEFQSQVVTTAGSYFVAGAVQASDGAGCYLETYNNGDQRLYVTGRRLANAYPLIKE